MAFRQLEPFSDPLPEPRLELRELELLRVTRQGLVTEPWELAQPHSEEPEAWLQMTVEQPSLEQSPVLQLDWLSRPEL